MGEIAVHADGDDIDSQFLEFGIFDGDRRQFCRSDAGEISRVKAQHYPLTPEIGEGDFFGGPLVKRLGGEIRGLSAYKDVHFRYLPAFFSGRKIVSLKMVLNQCYDSLPPVVIFSHPAALALFLAYSLV
jgi:hypothetical protein